MSGHKNRHWSWIAVVALGILTLYPLSQGPVIWLYIVRGEATWLAPVFRVYRPIYVLEAHLPESARKPYRKYCSWWIRNAEESPLREPLGS